MSFDSMEAILWNHIWQTSVVACTAAVLVRFFGSARPHLAHALWGLVLLKCITPPIVASPTGVFSWFGGETQDSQTLNSEIHNVTRGSRTSASKSDRLGDVENEPMQLGKAPRSADVHQHSNWRRACGAFVAFVKDQAKKLPLQEAWILGSLALAVWSASRLGIFLMHLRMHARRRSSDAVRESRQLELRACEIARKIGMHPHVRVVVLDVSIGPAIIGLFRPCIVLPLDIVRAVSRGELDALLAHELVHFRRGDLLWSLVQALALAVAWCNPLIWLASKRLSHETELCCDEETIASLGIEPAAYANCLIAVLEQKHTLKAAPVLPGVRPIEVTSKRLEKIMRLGHGSQRRCPHWIKCTFLLGAVIALPGLPLAFGQEKPPVEKTQAIRKESLKDAATSPQPATKDQLAIRYVVRIVELPAGALDGKLETWNETDNSKVTLAVTRSGDSPDSESSDASEVLPAAFTFPGVSIRKSGVLQDDEIRSLLDNGKVLMCPKVVAFDGQSAEFFSGSEVPFVTSCEMAKDEDGNESTTIQPVVTNKSVGTEINLTGHLNSKGDSVQLQVEYKHTELNHVDKFTFETAGGPFEVDRPSFSSNGLDTTLNIPVGGTVAVSGGQISRIITKQTSVPVLGKIPYIKHMFKNVAAATVKVTPVLLISCDVVPAPDLPAPALPLSDATTSRLPEAGPRGTR
ncbi:MAG: hypothetical protein Aurels2KO_51840 [Aureliella sp.]